MPCRLALFAVLLLTVLYGTNGCHTPRVEEPDIAGLKKWMLGQTSAPAQCAKPLSGDYEKVLRAMLPAMGSDDAKTRQRSQQEIQEICWRAARPGADRERKALCRAIATVLKQAPGPHARTWLLRQLGAVGGPESVPAVASFLADEDPLTQEYARRALENISGPTATRALCDAAGGEPDQDRKAALLDSIGRRHDQATLPVLLDALGSPSPSVRTSAIVALGRTGGNRAAEALLNRVSRTGIVDSTLRVALLDCAVRFETANDKAAATRLYRILSSDTQPVQVRIAALLGELRCHPENAVPLLETALHDSSVDVQGAAIGAIGDSPEPAILQSLVDGFAECTPEAQALLLRAVARSRLPAARKLARSAAGSRHTGVRLAAIETLGMVGDAQSVNVLVKAAADTEQAELHQTARKSLATIPSEGVNSELQRLVPLSPPAHQTEIVRALHARGCTDAVPLFFTLIADADADVRAAAIDAVGDLASPETQPRIIAAMRDPASERDTLTNALVAVARRTPVGNQRTRVITHAMQQEPEDVRIRLIRALGKLGGDNARETITETLRSGNPALVDAAVRALCDWQDARVAEQLLAIAGEAANPVHRVLALRACVRVVGPRTDGQTLARKVAILKELYAVADRDEERRQVIAGVGRVVTPESLEFLLPLLENTGLTSEAAAAAIQVAEGLSYSDCERARSALETIAAATPADNPLHTKAGQAMGNLEDNLDFITAWLITGPYTEHDKAGESLLKTAYPPEKKPMEALPWRAYEGHEDPRERWLIPLEDILGGDNRVAYMMTWFRVPEPTKVQLEIGSDDAVKAWVNGDVVLEHECGRPCRKKDETVIIPAGKGWNRLLLKIVQYRGHWAACVRLRAENGNHMPGCIAPLSLLSPREILSDLHHEPFRESASDALKSLVRALSKTAPDAAKRIQRSHLENTPTAHR